MNWKLIDIENHSERGRGTLFVAEFEKEIPFFVQRIYFMKSIPMGAIRGGQRHRILQQVLIPISGSFEVELEMDGQCETILLSNPQEGLYIAPAVKRTLKNFSSDAICLVLASEKYDPLDIV